DDVVAEASEMDRSLGADEPARTCDDDDAQAWLLWGRRSSADCRMGTCGAQLVVRLSPRPPYPYRNRPRVLSRCRAAPIVGTEDAPAEIEELVPGSSRQDSPRQGPRRSSTRRVVRGGGAPPG